MAFPAQTRIANLERELHAKSVELALAQLRIQQLEILLREQRVQFLGPRSETLSDLQQLLLIEQEPGTSLDEVQAEARREPVNIERERKPHPGRQHLPEHLPRVEETILCPPEACRCAQCGQEMAVIGFDVSEQLDREPVKYFVRVTRREKRACRQCVEATVVAAPLPDRIVEKGLASDAVVIDTVISKYCDHLPLYRQEAILERETGIGIGRATLDGWVMRVGELLIPVSDAMRKDLLGERYLQADETTVPVQMHDKRGSDHQAYLWQYGKPGGETVFDFRMGRERDGPMKFLGQWEGILQTDGYQAYDRVGGPKLVHVGCWAHARRKFVDAVKVNKDDGEAFRMVERMDALFTVDRQAREMGLSAEERIEWRRNNAWQWAEEIHAKCVELAGTELPKSSLGKAVTYTRNMWIKLKRCLEHGEVELSNNLAENSMRPVALGRKNWLHVGSERSGPKVAAILTVVESCRRVGAPVKDYLAEVLPGLDNKTVREVAQLTPARWWAAGGG
jgi:transposase